MNWRGTQAAGRERFLAKYDAAEAEHYDSLMGTLSHEDQEAYLSDVDRVFQFRPGMTILDAGAGTGTLCKLFLQFGEFSITALEPSPAMLAILRSKTGLNSVNSIQGFCDHIDDRRYFRAEQFDVIASRQLVNCLFDPIVAFENWNYWLSPGGAVILMDGLYGRSAWTGKWEQESDVLPLSACQTTALTPYLLERAGFHIDAVEEMKATNQRPSTKTARYIVVATKRP